MSASPGLPEVARRRSLPFLADGHGARLGSRMHGIHLLIRSLRPRVRPVLAVRAPRVPVLVKGIALVVESGEIRRHPDTRAT